MPLRAARWLALPLVLLALTAACDSSDGSVADPAPTSEPEAVSTVESTSILDPTPENTSPDMPSRTGYHPLTITKSSGAGVALQVELAVTPEERAQGLMGRTQLAPDSGMLFVIEPPGRGFWMRGTTLPLTVAFIGECGEIVDFADLEPLSEEIENTDRPYAFALEMERGWFTANDVAAGDTLQLPPRLQPESC
jgi:uncharacterized membrane protein (UPF0127 family)